MSTKKIREALKCLKEEGGWDETFRGAMEEVEAIEKAATVLHREDVAGFVYNVRERAASDRFYTGNTWEHPRVVAYGEAAQVIDTIAKESK